MLLAALCLQSSFLTHPLYLDEAKPEVRSAEHILLLHDDLEGLPLPYGRGREATLALATSLREQLEGGADFAALALAYSNSSTAQNRGVLGSYPPGMLAEPMGTWLWGAELGELSPVFDSPRGVHLLRRIETHAGVLMIQLDGSSNATRAEAADLIEQLAAGAEFSELARKHSDDLESASRGGQYKVFERGAHDVLLKAAAFSAEVGEVVGPLESPLGLHILKRVEPDSLPRELWEDNFIRARAIVVAHLKAFGVDPGISRTQTEALALAEEVLQRVERGEDFAEIAARFNDDPGGLDRRGDLGWVYRHNPDLPHFMQRLYLIEPGSFLEPIQTPAGYVVVRRER
jgi:parvulin-like peptidyl-prolyl isomerase